MKLLEPKKAEEKGLLKYTSKRLAYASISRGNTLHRHSSEALQPVIALYQDGGGLLLQQWLI